MTRARANFNKQNPNHHKPTRAPLSTVTTHQAQPQFDPGRASPSHPLPTSASAAHRDHASSSAAPLHNCEERPHPSSSHPWLLRNTKYKHRRHAHLGFIQSRAGPPSPPPASQIPAAPSPCRCCLAHLYCASLRRREAQAAPCSSTAAQPNRHAPRAVHSLSLLSQEKKK
ncbi:hypothetical protein M0R45_038441 [Rubus argutus]|uniref:Uncharacterized protein n=1 Tax=Rubus argutus TaxID=59490 RepID=A0AAW1W2E3_RUBAR